MWTRLILRVSKIDIFVSLNLSRKTKNNNINMHSRSVYIKYECYDKIYPNEDMRRHHYRFCVWRERHTEREPLIHSLQQLDNL